MCRGADARGRPRRCPEYRPRCTSTGLVRPWWSLNHDRGRVLPMRHRNLAGSRDSGLRRLSRLTFRASLLSVVAAFGMATLFAKTTHSGATVSTANTSQAGQRGASTGPSPSASGSPSPSPSASARAARKAHHRATTVAPAASQSSHPAPASAPAPAKSSAPAPKPTIAPPTHTPAPAPSKTPAPAPSSTSHPA